MDARVNSPDMGASVFQSHSFSPLTKGERDLQQIFGAEFGFGLNLYKIWRLGHLICAEISMSAILYKKGGYWDRR